MVTYPGSREHEPRRCRRADQIRKCPCHPQKSTSSPVSSVTDIRLAWSRHIRDAELLREQGLFVAEGRLVVKRVLANRRYLVDSLLAEQGFARGAPAGAGIGGDGRCRVRVSDLGVRIHHRHQRSSGLPRGNRPASSGDELAGSSRRLEARRSPRGCGANADNVGTMVSRNSGCGIVRIGVTPRARRRASRRRPAPRGRRRRTPHDAQAAPMNVDACDGFERPRSDTRTRQRPSPPIPAPAGAPRAKPCSARSESTVYRQSASTRSTTSRPSPRTDPARGAAPRHECDGTRQGGCQ